MDEAAWRWLHGGHLHNAFPPITEIVNLIQCVPRVKVRSVRGLDHRLPFIGPMATTPGAMALPSGSVDSPAHAHALAVGYINTPDYDFARVHGYFIGAGNTKM